MAQWHQLQPQQDGDSEMNSTFASTNGSDLLYDDSADTHHSPRLMISSTPKMISRRLKFDCADESDDDDVLAGGGEGGGGGGDRGGTPPRTLIPRIQLACPTLSPPYRKVRALRLADRPLTPKTLTANSVCTPLRRSQLFPTSHNNNTNNNQSSGELGIQQPMVNVNPFTPQAQMKTNKKRMRNCSPGITSAMWKVSVTAPDDEESDIQPPPKRLALSENNISRYHHEFAEICLLGSGQYSQVYKCINRLDGCVYAIKRSKKPVAGSWNERAALNEVWAHAVLDWHENVVGYHSAWAEHNHMYIQTEYCNRGALGDKIATEPLEYPECQRLLQQVAEGLNYMHAHQLVHLDIKPDNIFISLSKRRKRPHLSSNDSADDGFAEDEEVTYKIGDLGHVASASDPQVEEGDCRYLPMEVLQDDYTDLKKADIFSLGLTVLEAAGYGAMPKNGDEWQALREGRIPKEIAYLPHDFYELLKSMIHADPQQRPTCEQVLLTLKKNGPPEASKSYEQLDRECQAYKLKYEILTKQLEEATRCIKSLTPVDNKRLVGKKKTRSHGK